MMRETVILVVTGLPGSGKTTAARQIAEWLKVEWVSRFNTRELRGREVDGTDNVRTSNEEFLRLQAAGEIWHPTVTLNPDGTVLYRRGYPPPGTWLARLSKDKEVDVLLIVTGPRAALEIKELLPQAKVVFLTATDMTLVKRMMRRIEVGNGNDVVSPHVDRLAEYRKLDIERDPRFDLVIDTEDIDEFGVASRIVVFAGFNPLALKLRRI